MLAERALHQGYGVRFKGWWLLTMLLGVEFLRATAVEWHRLIFTHHLPSARISSGRRFPRWWGSTPCICNGGPAAHAGLILSIRGYVTQAQSERVAALSLYWHFVDVVWIVVFLVVYVGR